MPNCAATSSSDTPNITDQKYGLYTSPALDEDVNFDVIVLVKKSI